MVHDFEFVAPESVEKVLWSLKSCGVSIHIGQGFLQQFQVDGQPE